MKVLPTLSAFALGAFCAGCATWCFDAERSARFVDENARYIHVDYGKEEHESTFVTPHGVTLPFRSKLKVLVTMPDGERFVAYHVMSPAGVLYKPDDGSWEYFEEGTSCIVGQRDPDAKDGSYILRFRGVMCANLRPPAENKRLRGGEVIRKPEIVR